MMARMLARRALSSQVGKISLDATLATYSKKGTVTFQGKVTKTTVNYSNAWFASYTPDDTKLDNMPPTATIVIQSAGTLPEA